MNFALTLTFSQYGFFFVSIIALAVMLTLGGGPERLAAATFACLMFISPYLTREGPIWVAAASGITFAILVALVMRYERWWLIGASGVQLVVFATHFAPLIISKAHTWSAITLRLLLWGGLMALCFFAAGESRWSPYARRNQQTHLD